MRLIRFVGIAAVVIFGVIFLLQLSCEDQLPFTTPGVVDEGDGEGDPVPESAPGDSILAEPLLVGSADARDDLYCAGLLFTAHRATQDVFSDEAQVRRDRVIALSEAGVGNLIESGAANATQTGAIADAHAELAAADFAAGTPRISVAECEVRGTRLLQ
jgi:hypothetical protein